MATPPLFYRSHSTLQQFDGDVSGALSDAGEEDSVNEAGGAGASGGQLVSSQHIHTNLLLVALLDHLSVLYLKDETQSNQLYKALVQALVSANVLKGFGSLDEASSLRAQYKLAFSKLLQSAISTITPKAFPRATTLQDRVRLFFEPRSTVRPPLLGAGVHGIINFNTSRYRDDFRQIARVGYGAYGSVFKVENKLDSCHYAVKKISFEGSEPDLWLKIINEVKLLAQLSHKHVVRYHNAWIEYDSPALRVSEEADQLGPPRLPAPRVPQALTYPSDEGTSGSGSSIVFVETPDLVPALVSHVGPSSGSGSGSDNSSGSSQGEVSLSSPSSDGVAQHNGQLLRPVVVLHIQMELCSHTLKDWLKTRNDRLSNNHTDPYTVVDAETNLHLLRQILKGLAFIHSNDLMHRDIKPKNIFLTQSEVGSCCTAKVGDFGLARHLSKGDEPLTPRPGRTNEPTLGAELLTCGVGTTIYAAPEQLNGSTYTQKCDMYSLGLVIFEMYQPFVTEMERIDSLNHLRRNVLPEKFITRWPQQADCIRDLLSETTAQRPSATELLESGLFNSQDQIISYLRSQNDMFYQDLLELKKLLKSRDADIRRKDAEITMLRRQLVSTESTQSDGNVMSKSTQTDGQGLS